MIRLSNFLILYYARKIFGISKTSGKNGGGGESFNVEKFLQENNIDRNNPEITKKITNFDKSLQNIQNITQEKILNLLAFHNISSTYTKINTQQKAHTIANQNEKIKQKESILVKANPENTLINFPAMTQREIRKFLRKHRIINIFQGKTKSIQNDYGNTINISDITSINKDNIIRFQTRDGKTHSIGMNNVLTQNYYQSSHVSDITIGDNIILSSPSQTREYYSINSDQITKKENIPHNETYFTDSNISGGYFQKTDNGHNFIPTGGPITMNANNDNKESYLINIQK